MAADAGALDWVRGWAALAAVVAPAWAAGRGVRALAVPGWRGVDAAVAEAVAGVAVLLAAAHVTGALGQLRLVPLAVVLVLAATAVRVAGRRVPAGPTASSLPPQDRLPRQQPLTAALAAAGVAGAWSARIADAYRVGIVEIDSLRYHLPLAATYRQTGSIVGPYFLELDHLATFAPGDGEVLHAVGMLALGTDALTPLVNLGWAALALAAAWSFGSARGAGGAALAGVAAVLLVPILTVTQPGSAKNDIAVVALVVAAAALRDRGSSPLAAAAAGVAVSVKLTALAPVAVVAMAAVVAARRSPRRLVPAGLVLVTTGSFWYLRNLVVAGTPVPREDEVLERFGSTVLDYLDDGRFVRSVVRDGLDLAFGPGWWLLLALALAGFAAGSWRGDAGVRVLALAGAASAAMYVVTPYGAGGPPGDPWLFPADTRFLTPALALGVVTLAGVARRWARLVGGLCAVAALAPLAASRAWTSWPRTSAGVAVAVAACVAAVAAVAAAVSVHDLRMRPVHPPPVVIAAVSAVGLVALTALVLDPHLDRRWTGDVVQPELAGWSASLDGGRIGIVGVGFQYPLYGRNLDVEVRYLGERDGRAGFVSHPTCEALVAAVAEADVELVLAGGFKSDLETAPEPVWLREVFGAPEAVLDGTIHVFALGDGVDDTRCPPGPSLQPLPTS